MPLAVEAPSLHCSERGVVLRSEVGGVLGQQGAVAQGACSTAGWTRQLSAKISVLLV